MIGKCLAKLGPIIAFLVLLPFQLYVLRKLILSDRINDLCNAGRVRTETGEVNKVSKLPLLVEMVGLVLLQYVSKKKKVH